MDYGLCLPNFPDGASPDGIEAAADVAERLGWSTVWTTDHVLVPHADAGDYGRIYEAILTLAWVGARHPRIRLGTSVIVVPQRNAVLLAKELATLDSLSGGRVIGGRRDRLEPRSSSPTSASPTASTSAARTSTRRSGCGGTSGRARPSRSAVASTPSRTSSSDRCPTRRTSRSSSGAGPSRALRRAGTLGRRLPLERDRARPGYAERIPVIRAAAEAAGRADAVLSARVRVQFDEAAADSSYAMRGSPERDRRRGPGVRRARRHPPGAVLRRDRSGRGRRPGQNGSTARSRRSSDRPTETLRRGLSLSASSVQGIRST